MKLTIILNPIKIFLHLFSQEVLVPDKVFRNHLYFCMMNLIKDFRIVVFNLIMKSFVIESFNSNFEFTFGVE